MAITKKPSMDYLADITKILNEDAHTPLASDEFTAEMFHKEYVAKFGNVSLSTISRRLTKMETQKKLKSRKTIHNGCQCFAYKLIK